MNRCGMHTKQECRRMTGKFSREKGGERKVEGENRRREWTTKEKKESSFFEDSTCLRTGTDMKHPRCIYARKPLQLDGYAQVRNDWKLVDFVPFRVIVIVAEVEKVLAVISV